MRNITTFFIFIIYFSNIISPLYSTILWNQEIISSSSEEFHYVAETFPNGHCVRTTYNPDGQPLRIQISNILEIVYEYADGKISKIHRLNNNGQILYTHSYLHKGTESMIGHLGFIERTVDYPTYTCATSYGLEICRYNEIGNIIEKVIDGTTTSYEYDEKNRLLRKTNTFQDKIEMCDALPCIYNDFGNLIQKKNTRYIYDQDNRLMHVISKDIIAAFTYDDHNRRVSKRVYTRAGNYEQTYLYFENIPIAIFRNGMLEQLAIPGANRFGSIAQAIAIETASAIYAPIYDIQWNISKLIDIKTKEIYNFDIDPFGKNLHKQPPITPWLFATKEYDFETGLVYFGHRYYDPSIARWLSRDPLYQDMNNLYTYCFNNPLRYMDPDGRFTIAIPLIDLTFSILGRAILKGLLIGGVAWAGAKGVQKTDEYFKEKEKKKQAEAERQLNERAQTVEGSLVDQATRSKEKEGKQQDGCPGDHLRQNSQNKAAIKEIEKELGRKLKYSEKEQLHRHISKQNYGYHEIIEEGVELFKNYD